MTNEAGHECYRGWWAEQPTTQLGITEAGGETPSGLAVARVECESRRTCSLCMSPAQRAGYVVQKVGWALKEQFA